MSTLSRARRTLLATAATVTPFALAVRFAHAYRARAGYPRPRPPVHDPDELGIAWAPVTVPSAGIDLPGWWMPARGGRAGPAVAVVHGWESARDRTLPLAAILHALGCHVLSIDVRGHGANPPEDLPVTAGEFGLDALAASRWLLAHPDVTEVAVLGHSMGGIGAVLAAAAEPRIRACIAISTPAGPYRLTRQTFRLARLPLPDPIAYPLAWFTTRVLLRSRGHRVADVSASGAIARFRGPVLLEHGTHDHVVPIDHLRRLERAVRRSRVGDPAAAPVATHVVAGGLHSWLYEFPDFRAALGRFLATHLSLGLDADAAEAMAVAVPAVRMPEGEQRFSALAGEPGGIRTLAGAIRRPERDAGGGA